MASTRQKSKVAKVMHEHKKGQLHAAAVRGERSKIPLGDLDGNPIEFPIIEPRKGIDRR